MEWINFLAQSSTVGELKDSLTNPFHGYSKEQIYYAFLELMFYVIILVGILWQFRRNGRKIRCLEKRVSGLENRLEGK